MVFWLMNPRARIKIYLGFEEANKEIEYNFLGPPVELYRGAVQHSVSAARNYLAKNVPNAQAGIVVREITQVSRVKEHKLPVYTHKFTLYPLNNIRPKRRR